MNIFVLDYEPSEAARLHLDKHIVKMPLETAQILSTVQHQFGNQAQYKPTHANHPCTIWARRSKENYEWLVELGLELCAEYSYRYGKRHACQSVIESIWTPPQAIGVGLTAFAQAMPDECKHPDAVTAYRNYYRLHKAHIASWTHRNVPEWMEELNEQIA
ncbi:hypothetical protein UFOVP26_41 [uncultured Caudovirales phage]|uniref:Uncharacterized protein n=1 Tax=uncultured Caudovirales phage TaxID=2100421 RepID=A0A6J7WMX7_9CAUD|nr:hypothetical protein UFOVP26_41 [uncultured Caudovirales phage]CAB4123793.1 hypothetical protein UFOVP44_56 [uncultured Caudovirales phage]CAB5219216.1 hypothetical protein UFOVP220_47 [uncultured Caudovirales phage]